MEWRKAIIILILSFALLNIFLLARYHYVAGPAVKFTLTQEQQEEIVEQLRQKDVTLDVQIPTEGNPQAFLEVEYRRADEKKVVENFLGRDAPLAREDIPEGRRYSIGSKQLTVMEKGIITFSNGEDSVGLGDLTGEQAEGLAAEFIEAHGGMPTDARHNSTTYDPNTRGYLINYVRYYEGFFMANSYIDVVVTPTGVKSYYQLWLSPIGYVGKKRPVVSPLTAMLRVISERQSQDKMAITHIEQGFYSRAYDADKWQMAPVWKIQLDGQDLYYVNAYTGELEQ